MEYLWAWGTLIHEKNLSSKISCQCQFIASVVDTAEQLFAGVIYTSDKH